MDGQKAFSLSWRMLKKEEGTWQNIFRNFSEACRLTSRWLHQNNNNCPHQSPGGKSLLQFRAQQLTKVV